MIRCVFVEDEEMARNVLKSLLVQYCPDVMVCAEADDIVAGKNMIETFRPDLVFLDIEMPVIKGIELAKRIKVICPNARIIFATGYGNYALEAFGVDAVDYIMKPYEPEDIKRAYNKALLIRDVVAENHVFIKTFGFFKTH